MHFRTKIASGVEEKPFTFKRFLLCPGDLVLMLYGGMVPYGSLKNPANPNLCEDNHRFFLVQKQQELMYFKTGIYQPVNNGGEIILLDLSNNETFRYRFFGPEYFVYRDGLEIFHEEALHG